jgi:hypothetical protein
MFHAIFNEQADRLVVTVQPFWRNTKLMQHSN